MSLPPAYASLAEALAAMLDRLQHQTGADLRAAFDNPSPHLTAAQARAVAHDVHMQASLAEALRDALEAHRAAVRTIPIPDP